MVASKLRSEKWDVTIEAITDKPDSQHRMDILAMRYGDNLDFDITISAVNVWDNIMKGFDDDRVAQVIIVAGRKKLCRNARAIQRIL